MFSILHIFKRTPSKKQRDRETMEAVNQHINRSQEQVYKAVALLHRPCNGRMVSSFMGVDSATVTPRLAELVKKGRIKIDHRKKGLDGVWRNYYITAKKS